MLPFSTFEEAEMAVERNLTTADALWFRYTAAIPDSCLFYLNAVFLFVIFNTATVPSLLLSVLGQTTFPYLRRFKLQPSFTTLPVAFRIYKSVMKTFIFLLLPLQLSSYPLIKYIGIRTSLPLPSLWEVLAQITVYFMIEDYLNYWMHRWLHTKWAYKHIHYKHHESITVTSLAAPYAHWLEVLLLGIPSFAGPAFVPGHMVTIWLWFALRQLEAIETHCGFDFPWWPTKLIPFYAGSEYHDYHHFVGGKSQNNFASVFTYCDYIYGTNKGYRFKKRYEAASKNQ
ncbi:hypothetical protein KP509_34G063500 [Ceratopteris richardii]|uniref:Fatty acid hydroxylase domain-containing protein n=2 Tax=Ceratopteris richardii TaxID=49495 RepID=A0A8T2QM07_CERRI|nr:hypothetical protein KP509_34G063500 [Ceratopteris richardii]